MSDTIHSEEKPCELNQMRTVGSLAGSDPHPPPKGPVGAGLPSIDVSPLKRIRANSLVTYGTGEISKRTDPPEAMLGGKQTAKTYEEPGLMPIQRQNASMFRKVVNMATYIIQGIHKNIRMNGAKLRTISVNEASESKESNPRATDEKGLHPDAPRNRSPSSLEDNDSIGGESQYDLGNVPDYKDDDKISDKIHCKRMNQLLAKEAGIRHYDDARTVVTSPSTESWTPPSEHGMTNSNIILPNYYFTRKNRGGGTQLPKFNYFDIILDDIRNVRKLNVYQLKYIDEKCTDQEKMRVIREFNDVVSAYIVQLTNIPVAKIEF